MLLSSTLFSFVRIFFILSVAFWPMGNKNGNSAPLKKTQLEIPQNIQDYQLIRVSILSNVPEVKLETVSPYQVFDRDGRPLFRGNSMNGTPVKTNGTGIQLGPQTFSRVPLQIQTQGDGIRVGGRVYRDILVFHPNPNKKLTVVNEVNLEDYLKGVLPWEANPSWSMEALKAQAVVSRTYALFQIIEKRNESFHLTGDVSSQVYVGKGGEKPSTNEAVDTTQGEILTYRGKIFPAYFHSTCGGGTTQADTIWGIEPHPALQGVKCTFCASSKHYTWQVTLSRAEIEKRLNKNGVKVSGVTEIKPVDFDANGRAKNIQVVDKNGKRKIRANDFRLWLDPFKLKSTYIRAVYREGDNFVIRGRGWGHGAGLCQYGMKTLAEYGYNYRQILEYYYPGAEIKKI